MKVVFTFPGLMDQQNIEAEMSSVPRAGDFVGFRVDGLTLCEIRDTTFYPQGDTEDDGDTTPFAYVVVRR